MPRPDSGLGWRLRYAQAGLTPSDLLAAASILEAYAYLAFECQQKEAARRLGLIKKAGVA